MACRPSVLLHPRAPVLTARPVTLQLRPTLKVPTDPLTRPVRELPPPPASRQGSSSPDEEANQTCTTCKRTFKNIIIHLNAQEKKGGRCCRTEAQKKNLLTFKDRSKKASRVKSVEKMKVRYSNKKAKKDSEKRKTVEKGEEMEMVVTSGGGQPKKSDQSKHEQVERVARLAMAKHWPSQAKGQGGEAECATRRLVHFPPHLPPSGRRSPTPWVRNRSICWITSGVFLIGDLSYLHPSLKPRPTDQ
jgi:hypothetical protein